MAQPELRDYQVADLAFYMATPRCGNFSDPGTGKTPSVCVYAWWLWTAKQVRTIWTMPKSLLKKNLDELLVFTEFRPEDVIVVDGTPKQRQKQMEANAKVFLMGFDCFARNWPALVELHPDIDCLIGDEWHLGFKTDGSKRTASLYEFMERTTRMVAMTGTIIDGRLDAAYPFIHLASPGSYSGGWFGFKMAHAIENDYGQVVAWRNPERVGNIFRKTSIRHTFEEAYGPEAKVLVHELCQMHPKQREAYDEFEEEALLELEESWLDGSLPGVNLIRCRQLMEHPQEFGEPLDKIKLTGKEERILIHLENHKNTGKPLIIFGALRPSLERIADICRGQRFRVGVIHGGVSKSKRDAVDLDFRNGDLDIVVASPATAGVGFNWGHVDHIIFASLDYMDSSFVQAYRRAIRGKRETPCLITVLEYEDSADQKIFAIVEKKSAMANAVDSTKERIKLRGDQPAKSTRRVEKQMSLKMADLIS